MHYYPTVAVLFPFDPHALDAESVELDGWKDRLDRRGALPRRWVGQLRRDLETEQVAASTIMEQVPVTVEEVRRILAGAPTPTVSDEDRSIVLGYREAMGFVLRQADGPVHSWDRNLIVNLHDRVLGGNFALHAGRLRDGPVFIVDRQTGDELFRPPPAKQVPALLDRALRRMSGLKAHPAVQSAWLHVAVAAIHPFPDGNGRTCRVLASAAMYRGGFRLAEFTSLEEWWGRHLSDYYGAFRCLGARFEPGSDVTPFIAAHVRAQLAQVRALDLRQRAESQIWTAIENILIERRFPERIAVALWEAFFGREVTAGYYRRVAEVSPALATTDLTRASAAGFLRPIGERRGRRYREGSGLHATIAQELGLPPLSGHSDTARMEIAAALAARVGDAAR